MPEYAIATGASLSYGALQLDGSLPTTYTKIDGLNSIPQMGNAPNTVDSTCFDDLVYTSSVLGLQEIGVMDFGFNLSHPQAGENINTVAGLDRSTTYGWKLAYANGITYEFKSKPSYSIDAVTPNDLAKFTLHLSAEDGFTITVPSTTL